MVATPAAATPATEGAAYPKISSQVNIDAVVSSEGGPGYYEPRERATRDRDVGTDGTATYKALPRTPAPSYIDIEAEAESETSDTRPKSRFAAATVITTAVMSSSLFDLALRPTPYAVNVSDVHVVEEATASFLAASLGDDFNDSTGFEEDGMVRLVSVRVSVQALRYNIPGYRSGGDDYGDDDVAGGDGADRGQWNRGESGEGDAGEADRESDRAPTTSFTILASARFRGKALHIPDGPDYLDVLVTQAFERSAVRYVFFDYLAASGVEALNNVSEADVDPVAVAFRAEATGDGGGGGSNGPPLPAEGDTLGVPSGTNDPFGIDGRGGSSSGLLPLTDTLFLAMSFVVLVAVAFLVQRQRAGKGGGGGRDRKGDEKVEGGRRFSNLTPSHAQQIRCIVMESRTSMSTSVLAAGSDAGGSSLQLPPSPLPVQTLSGHIDAERVRRGLARAAAKRSGGRGRGQRQRRDSWHDSGGGTRLAQLPFPRREYPVCAPTALVGGVNVSCHPSSQDGRAVKKGGFCAATTLSSPDDSAELVVIPEHGSLFQPMTDGDDKRGRDMRCPHIPCPIFDLEALRRSDPSGIDAEGGDEDDDVFCIDVDRRYRLPPSLSLSSPRQRDDYDCDIGSNEVIASEVSSSQESWYMFQRAVRVVRTRAVDNRDDGNECATASSHRSGAAARGGSNVEEGRREGEDAGGDMVVNDRKTMKIMLL